MCMYIYIYIYVYVYIKGVSRKGAPAIAAMGQHSGACDGDREPDAVEREAP